MSQRHPKAVALISGGLDSTLAARCLQELGVEVRGLGFDTGFLSLPPLGNGQVPPFIQSMQKAAAAARIPLEVIDVYDDFLNVLLQPQHGYGSGVNPCIDCKILFLRRAHAYLKAWGGDFLVTGEVVGQRPMSQNAQALRIIEKQSGCEDILLRPLSALCLLPTKPEREGLVDRRRLFGFSGRNRKEQIALAGRWGITDYPQPAGGCILTDKKFAQRFQDFRNQHSSQLLITKAQIARLRLGRHFRLPGGGKIIVGRNLQENENLLQYREHLAAAWPVDYPGPVALIEENNDPKAKAFGLAAVARYSDSPRDIPTLVEWEANGVKIGEMCLPVSEAELEAVRI